MGDPDPAVIARELALLREELERVVAENFQIKSQYNDLLARYECEVMSVSKHDVRRKLPKLSLVTNHSANAASSDTIDTSSTDVNNTPSPVTNNDSILKTTSASNLDPNNATSLDNNAMSSSGTGNGRISNTADSDLSGFQQVHNKKKKKIMQAVDTSIATVLGSIQDNKCSGFTLKQASVKGPVKITISDENEIPVIRAALQANGVSFHEFKLNSEKQGAYLIRGLVGIGDEEIPNVLHELCLQGIPNSSKLSRFVTGYMRANPNEAHNSLLKLVVPPNFDESILRKIKYINHIVISFEKIKSKPVLQCYKCQRFGHSASGCHNAQRCVKCGAKHLRDVCPRTHDKSVKLYCCNCGGNHTANNLSNCPYFLKNFGPKEGAKDVPSTSKSRKLHTAPANIRAPGVSFAEVVGAGAAKKNNNHMLPNFAELAKKMDTILNIVMRHDALLQNLTSHG